MAHANWEWWTAANGASFHNLDSCAKELAGQVGDASQEGIKILDDAIKGEAGGERADVRLAAPAAPNNSGSLIPIKARRGRSPFSSPARIIDALG